MLFWLLGMMAIIIVMALTESDEPCPPPPPECLNCADGFKNNMNGTDYCTYVEQGSGGGEGGGPGI
jgi:hypothetical protein